MEEKTNYLFGMHPVFEAISAGKNIEKVFLKKGLTGEQFQQLFSLLQEKQIAFQFVPVERLDKITRGRHQGVIAVSPSVDYVPLEDAVEQAFANPELVKGKALVIGAGRSGTELGIWLKEQGKDISVIEARETVDPGVYAVKIGETGLEITAGTKAKEIKADGVICETAEGEKFIAADTVVLALGVAPLWDEVDALAGFAGEFYQAGDCRKPRNIIDATGEAWTMANLIGRH